MRIESKPGAIRKHLIERAQEFCKKKRKTPEQEAAEKSAKKRNTKGMSARIIVKT